MSAFQLVMDLKVYKKYIYEERYHNNKSFEKMSQRSEDLTPDSVFLCILREA